MTLQAGVAPSIASVFRFGWDGSSYRCQAKKTVSSRDATGDGKADVVRVQLRGDIASTGTADVLEVSVNGIRACGLNLGVPGIDQASVSVITLANRTPLLFVDAHGASGATRQILLQYRNGSFATVADNELLVREGAYGARITSIKPSGNRAIVQYDFYSTVTGLTRTSFVYVCKANGSVVRSGNATSALMFVTEGSGAYTKSLRKAARSFVSYADSGFKRRAFTVAKGGKVRPLGLRLSGDRLCFKVRFGKRTGYVRAPSADALGGGRLLAGTYGKATPSNAAAAYSRSKRLAARTLQKMSNHALYLSRNEIYARNGFAFSSAELKAYFGEQGWYAPKKSSAVTLGKVDSANVALIRSIERYRNSPYVS